MKSILSKRLVELRKEHGNTQETLANHIGISVQAVSKWERGEGMPDISLLPRIASFYCTTVDYLLASDEKSVSEWCGRVAEEYNRLRCNVGSDGLPDKYFHLAEGVELLRGAVKLRPDCWYLVQLLASDLWCLAAAKKEASERMELLSEAEYHCTRLLDNCREERWRGCVKPIYCLILKEEGKQDMAVDMACGLPCPMDTSDYILTMLLDGAELDRQLPVSFEIFLRGLYCITKRMEEVGCDNRSIAEDSEIQHRLAYINSFLQG